MSVDVRPHRLEIALPEGFEDQPISRLGTLEKAGDIETIVRSEERADTGAGRRQISQFGGVRIGLKRRSRRVGTRFEPRLGVGGLENRLLVPVRSPSTL